MYGRVYLHVCVQSLLPAPLLHMVTRHPTVATPTVPCLLPAPLLPPTHCDTYGPKPLTCLYRT